MQGPRDRRQRELYPTAKGRALALALARPQSRRIRAALESSGATERAVIERFLKAMVNPELQGADRQLCPANTSREKTMETIERADQPAAPDDDAPHLLVVDDDTRIRNLLKQYLTENGFRVTVAGNADEARRKLAGLDFDLLMLDVMMPGETGVDLDQVAAGKTRPCRS